MTDKENAILWDLDGTIVDTKACHVYTWEKALQRHGFAMDMAVFETNFGRNNSTLLPILLGFTPDDDLMTEIIEDKEAMFRQIAPERITLVPGVKTWLSAADELNYAQAIASSAPMENISTMLEIFNLESYFKSIVSGTDLPAKPEPDVFFQAAQALAVHTDHCVVIEDSIAGVEAAHRAGMRCIAVSTTHPRSVLGQADLVIDDFTKPMSDALRRLQRV